MECAIEQFCTICHNSDNDRKYDLVDKVIKYILNDLLKLDFNDNPKQVICNSCSLKFYAAFDFKRLCVTTNDTISSYVNLETTPIDLRDVCMKETGTVISDDTKICRLCMHSIENEFFLVQDVKIDLQRFIPEVNFSATKDPLVCNLCLDALVTHSTFINEYLGVEKKSKSLLEEKVTDRIFDPHLIIKSEQTEEEDSKKMIIKTEVADSNLRDFEDVNKESLVKLEEVVIKSEVTDEQGLDVSQFSNENCMVTSERDKITINNVTSENNSVKNPLNSEVYDSVDKIVPMEIEIPQSKQRPISETFPQMFGCELCSFKSKSKRYLKQHMSVHKDDSQVKWHECTICDYKSKLKTSLKLHLLIHKDDSEIKWHECKVCNFKTKRKSSLRQHMLVHKDDSEVQWFECDVCNFKSKRRRYLNEHMVIHKDDSEIEWRECPHCSFKSKHKISLNQHMLIHKNDSDVQWHECNVCSFKSKYKGSLVQHLFIHKDQWNHCEICGYKCKQKSNLSQHMLTHKDMSEMPWHECTMCHYKSKQKVNLKKHMAYNHKNSSS